MHKSAVAADHVTAAIAEDMRSGKVPATVRSFTDLHLFVDANEYLTQAGLAVTGPEADEGLLSAVCEVVSERLRKAQVL